MLQQDEDLRREDIQLLASCDALAAFFARLGYDTNYRLTQSAAAMNITGDTLNTSIKHIERLASQDGGLFEVYIFELTSVTVAATQGIVRAFRNRPGDYLLVLTDDYVRLDFVLVERYTQPLPPGADQLSLGIGARTTVGVRPRVLTVQRRNPDQVALRVLRRFSFTESDTFAQYDKLISAYSVAEWSKPYFNNRALFSDYYLIERLAHDPADAAPMTLAYRELRTLYADARETIANQPEAVMRVELLEPALRILGFTVSPVAPASGNEISADYQLDIAGANTIGARPLALCLAYPWNRSLDGKTDSNHDPRRPDDNPGASVVTLLDSGEAGWAIVTNGKLWRLYSAHAHSRATNYYEIDLEETLALPPEHRQEAFSYFWRLFHAAAFVPADYAVEGEARRLCFLDYLLSESERYARRLGDRLKERVFEEIFPHFARGFILSARRAGSLAANLEDLPAGERNRLLEPFFNGTLTFLYRLLFLLYAESRDLLPAREERGYYPHSLEALKKQIADKAGNIKDQAPARIAHAYSEHSAALYDRLQTLFRAVDQGDPLLNVPVYNGGLFVTRPDPADDSPEAAVATFLATHTIPDRQLALGLDLMARDVDEHRHDLAFIDYKSLGVRQLGSIYEGLLEFKLRVAPETMAVVQGKRTDEIVPYHEAVQQKLKIAREGRGKDAREKTYPREYVYLENDRRERKATGSYYTPDYIVKYIVEHSVGPILQEKLERLRPLFREAEQTLRHERDKAKALKRADINAEHETYKKYRQAINNAFFDLTVLDPAMGSGHFLVEAVDYITDRMADFLAGFKWNPIVYDLALTRQGIQQAMERQSITIDVNKLTDLNLLKRQVLKRCIYGVDLNPMAVELAKVSLWLDCFTLGAPLSFLDHHMKCGNSLIGGRIDEARTAIEEGQLSFFGSNLWAGALLATRSMIEVGRLSDVTSEQVRESKQHYRAAADALAPFKRILDIYVSRWFGNEPIKGKHGKADVDKAIDFLRSPEAEAWYQHPDRITTLTDEQRAVVATAMQASQQHRFFHWELEFPEIFFAPNPGAAQEIKLKDNPGFDAVVGNPPYVRVQRLDYDDIDFFKSRYFAAYRRVDIATLFLEQSINLLEAAGISGLILTSQFMMANYGQELRKFLLDRTTPTILDLKDLPVFEDALTYACICLSRKIQTSDIYYANLFSLDLKEHPDRISEVINRATVYPTDKAHLNGESWTFGTHYESDILDKITKNSDELGAIGEARTGLFTGLDEVMMIYPKDEERLGLEKEILLPVASGTEPDRYLLHDPYKKVIYPYKEVNGDTVLLSEEELEKHFPKTYAYLKQAKPKLMSRRDSRREFSENKKWYQLTRFGSLSLFHSRKILTPGEVQRNSFCLDESGLAFSVARVFAIISNIINLHYLLAILNSRLLEYQLKKISPPKQGGYSAYTGAFLERALIRRITFTLTPEQRDYYREKARLLYATCLDKGDQQCVLGFVDHHLAQQPEQSDVVHDLLALLAEEMIRLNKEKRAAIKQFLGWLETTIKILPDREGHVGIDALTGKSKLLDYPGDYQKGEPPLSFDDLLGILRKNRTRLGVSLSDPTLLDRLRATYDASKSSILPLKDKLAATDALIDAVVYRLYGLTEEEIKVVEDKQSIGY